MTSKDPVCSFTGHRPNKLPWKYNEADERCILLKERLYDIAEAVYFSGVHHFICGMAMGCDLYFCEILLSLKKIHPDIVIEAAIPCESQAARWNLSEKKRYERLLEQCDIQTVISRAYTNYCMMKRNRYMIDHSSILIAVFDGALGGTMKTVIYAKQQGLEIIQITP